MDNARRNVNIYFHVIILFTFLSVFYFSYLANVQAKAISSSVTNKIPEQVDKALDTLDYLDKNLSPSTYPNTRWDLVKKASETISKPDPDVAKTIKDNNMKLVYTAIGIICGLIVGLIALIIYYKSRNHKFNIWGIVLENLVIFAFVGVIEYLFFKNVASKYIPTTPFDVSNTILDRLSSRLV